METDKQRALRQWRWCQSHMEKLINLDAPKCIIADLIIHLILPRLIELTDTVEECGQSIGRKLSEGLAGFLGMCRICKKAYAIQSEEVCPKCLEILNQYSEECGLDEEMPE